MKKYQLSTWLGLYATATILGCMIMPTLVKAQNCSPYNSSVVASVRQRNVPVGNILINNNYSSPVSIKLYHSDVPAQVFATYNLAASQSSTLTYGGQNVNIRGDFGVQIYFGNGAVSCIYPVADVGRFENGRYTVTATNIYEGTLPQNTPTTNNPPTYQGEVSSQTGSDNIEGGGANGYATFYRNGILQIKGEAWSNQYFKGTKASVFVILVDGWGRALYISRSYDIPTACSQTDASCASTTSGAWTFQAPTEVAPYIARVDVIVTGRNSNYWRDRVSAINNAVKAYDNLDPRVKSAIEAGLLALLA